MEALSGKSGRFPCSDVASVLHHHPRWLPKSLVSGVWWSWRWRESNSPTISHRIVRGMENANSEGVEVLEVGHKLGACPPRHRTRWGVSGVGKANIVIERLVMSAPADGSEVV